MTNKNKPAPRNQNSTGNRVASRTSLSITTGPLPHPEILSRYNSVVPGAAERIIVQFEKQSMHRMELEKKVVNSDINKSYFGIISALIISLSFGFLGFK